MMSSKIFDSYARYYDLLNRSKDYAGEAHYVHELIQRHAPQAKELLEFGCGTGMHAVELVVKFGYHIHGVDQSQEMLAAAESHRLGLTNEQGDRLTFSQGDIRRFKVNRKFDAVIALFHVVSYLPANADLISTFRTAREHLKPGGVFIFDCWYGPGVLTDRPTVRVREWEDDSTTIIRIAQPMFHPNENLVDVKYQINVHDKESGRMYRTSELHRMRYLFMPELEVMLECAEMKVRSFQEWAAKREVGFDSWILAVTASTINEK